jgi:hypothetical protein
MRYALDCYGKGVCSCGPCGVLWAPSTPLMTAVFEWWLPTTPEFKLNSFMIHYYSLFIWSDDETLIYPATVHFLKHNYLLIFHWHLPFICNGKYREHIYIWSLGDVLDLKWRHSLINGTRFPTGVPFTFVVCCWWISRNFRKRKFGR